MENEGKGPWQTGCNAELRVWWFAFQLSVFPYLFSPLDFIIIF